ncbi:hypothetical protein L1857_08525 [Amycolatopsis thermalba]|uniref:VWFA domain-containing protein n=1 Tax=Amycolatopsis thermalba TaxID=944492 RepID=A0ABY4NS37_9PSEU|nr:MULTISPECIES: hypothetical protein [Amycolatopsis]UQS22858.1 hypothetical protein L1857_08525 [Amycolatopsis thermalba]
MSLFPRIRHRLAGAVVLLAVLVIVTACSSAAPQHGELADDQRILASCDPSAPPASLVEIDGTGSSASDQITAERMEAIESVVRRTAICSGQLGVLVFSSSSAATTMLFDEPLQLEGATDNARLKRVPEVVSDVMAKIRAAYTPAVTRLDQNGSDITAQYRLANEWITQLGGKLRLHLYVFTDGFQNVGVNLGARALSKQEAEALANQVNVPKLTGATVVIAGLGRVAGVAPRSDVVEGLVAYYDALCRESGAAKCLSVTDYTAAGQ